MADKRQRSSPTGRTPQRPSKRVPLRGGRAPLAPKCLSFDEESSQASVAELATEEQPRISRGTWTDEETKALLEFLLLNRPEGTWTATKNEAFWSSAAEFVQQRGKGSVRRSGASCRSRTTFTLARQFVSPLEAERYYTKGAQERGLIPQRVQFHSRDSSTQTDVDMSTIVDQVVTLLGMMPEDEQLHAMNRVFQILAAQSCPTVVIPDDFVSLCLKAMERLKQVGRYNVVYGMVRGLGTMREDNSDSRLPALRMPMGLLEYTISFYSANTINQVMSCPTDYSMWCETMFSLFGTKWSRIHVGPMWSGIRVAQDGTAVLSANSRNTVESRVNIPAPSLRTLQRAISASSFTMGAELQTKVLEEAARVHPTSWWWVKADGCDLVRGLKESVKLDWSGDVDLNDGKVAVLHSEYKSHLSFLEAVGKDRRKGRLVIMADLCQIQENLKANLTFLSSALEKTSCDYSAKIKAGTSITSTIHALAWSVDELGRLIESGRKAHVELQILSELLREDEDMVRANVPRRISELKDVLRLIIKGVYRYRRTAATHVLVVMISTETRSKKPYALPVQCIPYASLRDNEVCVILNTVIKEMVKFGMKVAGECTNGEWNTLRHRGNTRPLSILQIRADARAKYSRMPKSTMMAMLTPIRHSDGSVSAKLQNPAVTDAVLKKVLAWKMTGTSEDDILKKLRQETVPSGYTIHKWTPGKDETKPVLLRSILSQMEYSYRVAYYHDDLGVPFRTHLYVPEVHPETGQVFCEREDEGHVFKRIGQSTREGGPASIDLEHFMEALHDPSTNLTYQALTGARKQSVSDVERLFSDKMVSFMEQKGYTAEGKYIRVVTDWRKACDERGLSDHEREKFNKTFLDYILDDLMPWHREADLSQLEVNRPIHGVCGFSQETLHALIADIEGREWRRKFNRSNGIPLEHPRSSTTDDVECFFSILRDMVGKDFTLKQVQQAWRKACAEMTKRLDPTLPYFYHTSSHDRFYEGERPSFDEPGKSKRNPRHKRPRCMELLSTLAIGRASLPVPGSRSVRMQFHNLPIQMPPPPDSHSHTSDHTYASRS